MTEARAGWAELIRRHGGLAARTLGEVDDAELAAAAFLGVVVADAPHAPALARLSAAQAVAALVLGAGPEPSADAANRLHAKLEASAMPCFQLNDGPIGGSDEQAGSIRLDRREADELIGAAMSGQLGWEHDPDFGYEVPLATPSLSGDRAMALAPRLAYAASGRVYEHASIVPRLKEERHALLASVGGLDPAIVAASGWPVVPTGTSWRRLR